MSFIDNPYKTLFSKRLSLAVLATGLIFSMMPWTALQAQPLPGQPGLQLDFPVQSPGVPAYARLELLVPNFDVPNNKRWAAIVFYRDPACVPQDFDLGQFFHFPGPRGLGALGCPLLVEGHEIWQNGPETDLAPIYVRTRNAVPNLPIWFVAWNELKPILASGQVFIGDIAGLPSLVRGSADWYEEALYPNGAAETPGITLLSEGTLEDGGKFKLKWHFVDQGAVDEVIIRLWRKPAFNR
ncbi:MAG: hypothetical protein HKN57_08320 [Xanthomonadales bacterium]|nr:hypothetical protein [Gammaproteobacteria bacterium]NND57244.1 hypothetical protein [Xanthomonadales bacterium]NNK52364.1 hypothetical protein [Xanthomonadales bacterium]